MAARKVQLKDNSGNKAYPVTSSACVGMSDGSGSLDEKISGIISNSGYVTCTAAAGTAAKTVTQANFTLSTNCRLIVKMANYNTAASPTLNVNNTGAKPLYYNGEVASADNTWEAGEVLDVYYDGENYYSMYNSKIGISDNCVNLYSENGEFSYIDNEGHIVQGTVSYASGLIPIEEYDKIDIESNGAAGFIMLAFYSDNSFFTCIQDLSVKFDDTHAIKKYTINTSEYIDRAKYVSVVCNISGVNIKYTPKIMAYKKTSILGGCIIDKLNFDNDILRLNAFEDFFYGRGFIKETDEIVQNTNGSGITSNFIPIDDSLIGIEILTYNTPGYILLAYFTQKNYSSIMKEQSVSLEEYVAYKFISKNDMPVNANYCIICASPMGEPFAYILKNRLLLSNEDFNKSKFLDLKKIYTNIPGAVYYDGSIKDTDFTNYAHIIIPVNNWMNISFKLMMNVQDDEIGATCPVVLFLKSNNHSDKIDEFITCHTYDINMICGYISDDDIPSGCTHILFNFRRQYHIDNVMSFIKGEKRKNNTSSQNKVIKYDNPIGYAIVEVTTDNLSEWPNDKTEHAASVKMSCNGSVIVQDSNATIEYQGSSTMAYPKKNFRIKFDNDHKFGNWAETKKYNLKAYYLDMSQMREVLMYHMAHLMYCSEPNVMKRYPFSNFTEYPTGARAICDLFPCELHINGVFHGLYHFGLAKDKKNLLIDEDNPLHFAFEPNAIYANQPSVLWSSAEYWDPVIHDEVPENIKAKFQEWLDFLTSSSYTDFASNASNHIDIKNWIMYLVLAQVVYGWDALSNNMQLITYDGGNTFYVFPYDGDNTFGFYNNNLKNAVSYEDVFRNYFNGGTTPAWITKFIFMFTEQLCDMFKYLYDNGVFTYQTFCSLVEDEAKNVPYSIYESNTEKWGYTGEYTNYPLYDLLKWYKERIWFLKKYFRYY